MKKEIPLTLIIKKLRNEISFTEEASLSEWIGREENKSIFTELEQLWGDVQVKSSEFELDKETSYYCQELTKRLNLYAEHKEKTKKYQFISFWKYAAAVVVLLVGIYGTFYFHHVFQVKEPAIYAYSNMNGKSKINLPDGTEVWMHAQGSAECYPRHARHQRCHHLGNARHGRHLPATAV